MPSMFARTRVFSFCRTTKQSTWSRRRQTTKQTTWLRRRQTNLPVRVEYYSIPDYGHSNLTGIEFRMAYRLRFFRHADQITQLLILHLESTERWSNAIVHPFPVFAALYFRGVRGKSMINYCKKKF